MATPQVQTVQRSPLEDLQKWMPIIQTMLANKSANKLAQKNEMGQLLQLKMKQMESGYTEEDQKQLELMQKQHSWMKGSYNLTDSIKSLLGLEKPPDTTPMLALSRLANPPSSMQAQGTLPNVPEMGEKPSPQDVTGGQGTPIPEAPDVTQFNPQRYKQNFDMMLNLQRETLTKGGQPIIGGKSYGEAVKNAHAAARALELKQTGARDVFPTAMRSPSSPISFMASKATEMGYDFNTPEGQRSMQNYFGTREGQKEYNQYLNRVAPREDTVTTGGGILRYNKRTGKTEVIGGKPVSQETLERLSGALNTFTRLERIEQLMQDPEFQKKVGPLAGRYNTFLVKFKSDGDFQYFLNNVLSLITIAYDQSGKQISIPELLMLREAMLPWASQTPENFMATIKFAKEWISSSHNQRLDYLRKSGYQTQIPDLEATQPEAVSTRIPGQY